MEMCSNQCVLITERTAEKSCRFTSTVQELNLESPSVVDQSCGGVGDVLVVVEVESRDVIPELDQTGVNVDRRLSPSST